MGAQRRWRIRKGTFTRSPISRNPVDRGSVVSEERRVAPTKGAGCLGQSGCGEPGGDPLQSLGAPLALDGRERQKALIS
jgi:hypothetical protein